MSEKVLKDYLEFVDSVTSEESKNLEAYIRRITELHNQGINAPRLQTAANGMASEAGEFVEIVKKMFFQGKPLTDENKFHMLRELGDIQFYVMQACMALNIDPYEVIAENTRKLSARYPGGFSVEKSENRVKGDI
jgi:NTP pyrophosphatase (non-canonical NTP hydrolase)